MHALHRLGSLPKCQPAKLAPSLYVCASMLLQPRVGNACDGDKYSRAATVLTTLSGFQAYKNGLHGLSATYLGVVRFTDVVMWDNGGGPRTLTDYTGGNTAGDVSGGFKLTGGNLEFGKVGASSLCTAGSGCPRGAGPRQMALLLPMMP